MDCCSVGVLLQQDCHKTTQNQELILRRTSLKDKSEQVVKVCMHHKEVFLGPRFELRFKHCCNIYKCHKRNVKGSISITLEMANMMEKLLICVKPGWRICVTCYKRFKIDYNSVEESETNSTSSADSSDSVHSHPDLVF